MLTLIRWLNVTGDLWYVDRSSELLWSDRCCRSSQEDNSKFHRPSSRSVPGSNYNDRRIRSIRTAHSERRERMGG